MKSEASGDTQVSWPLENESSNKTIRVEHDMEQKSENVSFDLFPRLIAARSMQQLILIDRLHLTPKVTRIINLSESPSV